jgi:hypothetical protein
MEIQLGGKTFDLKPTIPRAYDFSRKIVSPNNQYEQLLCSLGSDFKSTARTEIYRKKTGWLARGVAQKKIRVVTSNGDLHILPLLNARRTVGIDSSTVANSMTVIVFAFLPDYDIGPTFLNRHIGLQKSVEYKWANLQRHEKLQLVKMLPNFMKFVCDGVLVIKTDALIQPIGQRLHILRNLIEGCFSGYERLHGKRRAEAREWYFDRCNSVEIHCDSDFSPLTPLQICNVFVRSLSAGKTAVPLFAKLESHESNSIQTADMLAGALGRELITNRNVPNPLSFLYFDMRKMKTQRSKCVKAYCFLS